MPDRDQCPPLFRPTAADIARIAGEVAEVSDIQKRLVGKHKQVQCPDRLAHEYQIAGGRVQFRAAQNLPATLAGVGVFQPNENYIGIGRISTGLGTPHIETNPDMLGARLSFMTRDGQPIDFLALNDPTAPTDTHGDFIDVLYCWAHALIKFKSWQWNNSNFFYVP